MIAGWAPTIDRQHAITMYTDPSGAVYRGLAVATNAGSTFLYATDIHNNKIDVFNAAFEKQPTSPTAFSFADPGIPAGFAPFGIQEISNGPDGAAQLYVTYVKQLAPDNRTGESGAGLGYVDVFDLNGHFVKQLIAGGILNAPWGLALAPADFGGFSGALLVANGGDGKINAYDPVSGAVLGTLADARSAAIVSVGLHGIAFGNDANNQPHNTLFFTAGGQDGVFGRIDLGSVPPVLNAPPVVTLTVPAGTLAGTVSLSAAATDPLKVAKIEFQANGLSIGAVSAAPFAIQWDTTTIADGQVSLKAIATDADGNVGSSTVSTITVTNTAPPAAATLTQLQTDIFTPICSGCHSGLGTALPGVMNLTAGNVLASLVDAQSLERPSLKRVTPNDVANSYLVQKLEGAAGIAGARMPFGCGAAGNPCLDPATIDRVKDWINHGAINN
jgi:Bacterial Ig domain